MAASSGISTSLGQFGSTRVVDGFLHVQSDGRVAVPNVPGMSWNAMYQTLLRMGHIGYDRVSAQPWVAGLTYWVRDPDGIASEIVQEGAQARACSTTYKRRRQIWKRVLGYARHEAAVREQLDAAYRLGGWAGVGGCAVEIDKERRAK